MAENDTTLAEREAATFSITDCDHGGQNFEVYEQGRGAVGHFDTRAEAERVMGALARSAGRAELEGALRDISNIAALLADGIPVTVDWRKELRYIEELADRALRTTTEGGSA